MTDRRYLGPELLFNGRQVWFGAPGAAVPAPRSGPVRIGDTERDQAVSTLSDHFAAGRLSRDELDERIDAAMAARFDSDLDPLFADLPQPAAARPAVPAVPVRGGRPVRAAYSPVLGVLMLLLPLLLVGSVVLAVVSSAPWLLWGLVWVVLFSGVAGRHRRRW